MAFNFRQLWLPIVLMLMGTIPSQGQTIPQAMDAVVSQSSQLTHRWTILFESADGSTEYYSRNPTTPMIPASNAKLFTTAAAIELLGADYVFETHVYYTGSITGTAPNRTITGDLVIIVEHDPTWNSSTLSPTRAGLNRIASRVRNEFGVSTISGQIVCRGAGAYGLGSTNTNHANFSSQQANMNQNVATNLRTAFTAAGVSVSNTTVSGVYNFNPPAGSTFLFTHRSNELNDRSTGRPLRLDEITISLNEVSHNVMADLLLRHIAYKLDTQTPKRDTYTVGGTIVRNWLGTIPGYNNTGVVVADGSGLSMSNRYSARQTVDLVRYMVPRNTRWDAGLPVSGVSGTMAGRLTGSLTGRVHAKTGTLPNGGVVSLSGYLDHPSHNRRYFFSIYANKPDGNIDTTLTRNAIDDVVRQLGNVLPPIGPDLYSVLGQSATSTRISWTDRAHTADTFRVYASDNGGTSYTQIHQTATPYIIEAGRSDTSLGLNNADYSDTGAFENSTAHSTAPGLTAGVGSRFIRPTSGVGTARFQPSSLPAGRYRIDITCFNFSSANAPNIRATIIDRSGTRFVQFDLSDETAGNRWRSVGIIDFVPGQNHRVEFSNTVQLTSGNDDRFNPAAVRFVPLYFTDSTVPAGEQRQYKVVAVGPRGLEGDDSDVYAANPEVSPRVLLVDHFNRWNNFAQNTTGANHDFTARVGESLDVPFDTVANEAITDGSVLLGDYDVVVWNFGEESTANRTFTAPLQSLVSSYLAGGGNLFISGSEVAWDLGRIAATESDKLFLENVLRVARFTTGNPQDSAQTITATGTGGNIFSSISNFNFSGTGVAPYNVLFPDVLNPLGGSTQALSYVGGTGGSAAIAYNGTGAGGKIIYLGFPFETITSGQTRKSIMDIALQFFGVDPTSVRDWVHMELKSGQ